MHGGKSLGSINYASDVFDASTGIWWHCHDDKITNISEFIEDVYTKESHKQFTKRSYVWPRKRTGSALYHNK